jgi:hypothetical protein
VWTTLWSLVVVVVAQLAAVVARAGLELVQVFL